MRAALSERISVSLRTFGQVVRNRHVRSLEAAWATALLSGWALSIAMLVYTYDAGGPGLVGVAYAIRLVRAAVAAAPLATLADRFSRKRVLIGAIAGLAVSTAAIAGLIAADGPVALVIAVSCLSGAFTTALQPAVTATLPSLCERPEELTAANVVNSTIESLSMFIGPAVGGLVVGFSGSATLAAVTGVGFFASAVFAARLPTDGLPASDPEDPVNSVSDGAFLASVADGFRVVARDRSLRLIVGLTAAQTFVDGALGVLTAVAALEILDTGQAGIGYLNSALGVGALAGSFAAAGMVGRRLAPSFIAGLVLWGLPIALVGVLTNDVVALILFGIVGVGNILIDVAGLTMLQRAAPEEMLARVIGVLETLVMASVALGSLAAPLLLELIGNEATFIVVGAILPVLAVTASRGLNSLDRANAGPIAALSVLAEVPFFRPLEPEVLESVAARAEFVDVASGQIVFQQGDRGERFYVIISGEVEVLVDGRRARVEGPGGFFGEIALLRPLPRTASVVALSATELLSIDGEDFVTAVSGHAVSRRSIDAVAATRLAHMRPGLSAH